MMVQQLCSVNLNIHFAIAKDHPLTRRMCLCVSKQQNFCQVRLTSSGKEDIDDDVKKILDFKYNYAVILGHYVVANTRNIISESSPVKYLERRPQLGPASASPTPRRKLRQELTPAQEISCSAAVTQSNEISQLSQYRRRPIPPNITYSFY